MPRTPNQPVVDGYVYCNVCDALALVQTAWQTKGRCFECFLQTPEMERIREIEVQEKNRRWAGSLPTKTEARVAKHAASREAGKQSPEAKQRDKARARAADQARKRLTRLYPEMYRVLVNEERHHLGLPPLIDIIQDGLLRTVVTYAEGATYDAPKLGDEHGPSPTS